MVAELHPGQARQALRKRLLRGFLPAVAQGFLQERLHRAAVRPPRELQRHCALHLPRILLRLPLDQRQVFARRGQQRLVAPLTQVRIQRIRQLLVPPNRAVRHQSNFLLHAIQRLRLVRPVCVRPAQYLAAAPERLAVPQKHLLTFKRLAHPDRFRREALHQRIFRVHQRIFFQHRKARHFHHPQRCLRANRQPRQRFFLAMGEHFALLRQPLIQRRPEGLRAVARQIHPVQAAEQQVAVRLVQQRQRAAEALILPVHPCCTFRQHVPDVAHLRCERQAVFRVHKPQQCFLLIFDKHQQTNRLIALLHRARRHHPRCKARLLRVNRPHCKAHIRPLPAVQQQRQRHCALICRVGGDFVRFLPDDHPFRQRRHFRRVSAQPDKPCAVRFLLPAVSIGQKKQFAHAFSSCMAVSMATSSSCTAGASFSFAPRPSCFIVLRKSAVLPP